MVQNTTLCNFVQMGQIEYNKAWQIQRDLADARAAGLIADTLLVLEHPHTYTLGRSTQPGHLLMSEEERARRGVSVIEVDRGGDITYHGPGQMVAYPIRYLGKPDLSGRLVKADYVGYIRNLEEVLIHTVAHFGIRGRREEGYTGVWVDTPTGPQKIAAIGVRVDARGISSHGIALNVTTDLSFFRGIIPCGITDKPVASLEALLGYATPSMPQVIEKFASAFAEIFGCQLVATTLDKLLTL
jgi:lipoyl(octanoyl) transferase